MSEGSDQNDYSSQLKDLVSAKRGENKIRLWRARLLDASALIVGGIVNWVDGSGWLALIVTAALLIAARSQWKFPTLFGWIVIFGIAQGIAHSLGT